MDLGATICTPREPDCDNCPLRGICQACEQGLAAALPIVRKQKKVPVRHQVALIVHTSHGCLLRQRPQEGLLGGLWEFPAVDLSSEQAPEQAAAHLLADLGMHGTLSLAGEVRHAYSHFKLELMVFSAEAELIGKVAETSDQRWCCGGDLAGLPLHGAHRKAYDKFKNNS
jgi:A/G-specific adenine glycosylase